MGWQLGRAPTLSRVGGHPWGGGWVGHPPCPGRCPQACAPLQHWNAMDGQQEAFRTPTGTCFVGAPGLGRVAWYSPCRDQLMASTYPKSGYSEDGWGGG